MTKKASDKEGVLEARSPRIDKHWSLIGANPETHTRTQPSCARQDGLATAVPSAYIYQIFKQLWPQRLRNAPKCKKKQNTTNSRISDQNGSKSTKKVPKRKKMQENAKNAVPTRKIAKNEPRMMTCALKIRRR